MNLSKSTWCCKLLVYAGNRSVVDGEAIRELSVTDDAKAGVCGERRLGSPCSWTPSLPTIWIAIGGWLKRVKRWLFRYALVVKRHSHQAIARSSADDRYANLTVMPLSFTTSTLLLLWGNLDKSHCAWPLEYRVPGNFKLSVIWLLYAERRSPRRLRSSSSSLWFSSTFGLSLLTAYALLPMQVIIQRSCFETSQIPLW